MTVSKCAVEAAGKKHASTPQVAAAAAETKMQEKKQVFDFSAV